MTSGAVPAKPRRAGVRPLAVLGLSLCAGARGAGLCPAEVVDEWLPWPAPELPAVDVEADSLDLAEEDVAILRGDVLLRDARQELRAEEVRYFRSAERAEAEGDVRYRNQDLALRAESAQVRVAAEEGVLQSVVYRLREGGGRGSASALRLQGQDLALLQDMVYTTCPLGRPDWSIGARSMRLDTGRGVGAARGMRLKVRGTTVLALPYATFPLDDRRKSGFLLPGIGSSNDNGLDLELPYYWNIAPERDATIVPRWISDRGVMLGAEYRYLGAHHRGRLAGAYLPEDDLTGRHRGIATWEHAQQLDERLDFNLDFNHVSDRAYFEDFGNSLTAASRAVLRSVARLSTYGDWWDAVLMADDYQTLDRGVAADEEPYNRFPRALFRGRAPVGGGFEFDVAAELAYFQRDVGVEGLRLDLQPALAWPVLRPAWELVPRVALRHTAYDLDRDRDAHPSRSTPIASLTGSLHFERPLPGGGLQTLEPRFHYLYVPFEEQAALPAFDTAGLTFSFQQLFRSNRFTGADRQADANQLGLGVTTRVFGAVDAQAVLEASAGTIVYFEDQRVQLPGVAPAQADSSAVVAELGYRPSDLWRASLGFQYDPEDSELDQGLLSLERRLGDGALVNFAYRQRRDLVEQVDASAVLPLGDRWTLIGRVNYSLLEDAELETLVGAEYDSCCWAVRAFARRFLRNQQGDTRTGLYLEFELKGLGRLGSGSGGLLEQAIAGYRNLGSG